MSILNCGHGQMDPTRWQKQGKFLSRGKIFKTLPFFPIFSNCNRKILVFLVVNCCQVCTCSENRVTTMQAEEEDKSQAHFPCSSAQKIGQQMSSLQINNYHGNTYVNAILLGTYISRWLWKASSSPVCLTEQRKIQWFQSPVYISGKYTVDTQHLMITDLKLT